jgi:membrane-associated phospholipid phosphatase
VHDADLEAFARVAAWHTPPLDRALPRLSNAANNSALWIGCAAVLAVAGGRFGQRAAARGLVSIGATSALVNLGLKPLARRQRPALAVPPIRRLRRIPGSTSFPSGHAASAAAFATGAALELPESALVVGPLAAGVAFSRIYTGVHYPSDALVGAAIGAGIALATTRVWPRPSRRARSSYTRRSSAPCGVCSRTSPDNRSDMTRVAL